MCSMAYNEVHSKGLHRNNWKVISQLSDANDTWYDLRNLWNKPDVIKE